MNRKTRELNQNNNALDRQIDAENQEAFTNMICYLRNANISEYHQELVRQDLTEMVLSAQQRGENIQKVIGEDYQSFCDRVIASLPHETRKQRIMKFLDTLCLCLSILGLISIVVSNETIALIRNTITRKHQDFSISISLANLIVIVMIITASFVIVKIITKNAFQLEKDEKGRQPKRFLIITVLTGVAIIGATLAITIWLGRVTLFTVNFWVACSIVIALYVVHIILDRI